ncbi:hypothetical protein HD806DRAFT_506518 [Xylariaceae sp. AK1471]|nr:hypothetical protein HD806DRAFT_506518 [Xylariaceae sp. AK1471]
MALLPQDLDLQNHLQNQPSGLSALLVARQTHQSSALSPSEYGITPRGSLSPVQVASSQNQDLLILGPVALAGKYSKHYTPNVSQDWDPIKAAYDADMNDLGAQLSPSDKEWLKGKHTMADVQRALEAAQMTYRNRSTKSDVRVLLASCSQRIVFYAGVFDSLSQHYPEYVSLVWGSLKFLFTVIVNHEDLLTRIARAVANVLHVLPRTQLLLELYHTPDMRNCVASLYAKVIRFVSKALKWYNKNKYQHAISAIVHPYNISFKDIIDDIAECSRRVDELANTVNKAEIRDMHDKVTFLLESHVKLSNTILQLNGQVTEALTMNRYLYARLLNEQGEHQKPYLQMHAEATCEAITGACGTTIGWEETLAFCRLIRSRRRLRTPSRLPQSEVSKLKSWISSPESSLMIAQARGLVGSSMDLAIDLIEALLDRKAPIIWALPRSFEADDMQPPLSSVLQSLALQILRLEGNAAGSRGLSATSVEQLNTSISLPQWSTILEDLTSNLKQLFIIIDANLIGVAKDTREKCANRQAGFDVVKAFQRLIGSRSQGGLKIMIASWPSSVNWSASFGEVMGDILELFTDRGIRQERRMATPKFRALAIRQGRIVARELRAEALKDDRT